MSWKEQKISTFHEDMTPVWVHLYSMGSCEGQLKSVGVFGACAEVHFVLKGYNYINKDTLEHDIWIPDHYIDTSNFTLWTKKH